MWKLALYPVVVGEVDNETSDSLTTTATTATAAATTMEKKEFPCIQFGVCLLHRHVSRQAVLVNEGNIGCRYRVEVPTTRLKLRVAEGVLQAGERITLSLQFHADTMYSLDTLLTIRSAPVVSETQQRPPQAIPMCSLVR